MKTRILLTLIAALAMSSSVYGQFNFDFDTTQPGFSYGFSEADSLTIDTTFDGEGNPGEGFESVISALTGQPSFAGIGWGDLDFGTALGRDPGSGNPFEESDFDNLTLSFDYRVSAGASANSTRLDLGDFNSALIFNAELDATEWTTASFSIADAIQLTEFVGILNSGDPASVDFQLSLSAGSDGVYAVNDQLNVDNFALNFTAIPEPSSAMLGLLAMSLVGIRRSRLG